MPYDDNLCRTDSQDEANKFDCDLYRLISRAENLRISDKRHATNWLRTVEKLHAARAHVRALMHGLDRRMTS